jgi:hypothetical protein
MPGESLILINPRRKRARSRRRNPKRRMPAALRRYWASRRGTRMSNPRRSRRRRNPVVHSYYRRKAVGRRRYANPRRRVRSFRRFRNPRGDLMHTLAAGAMGAGGALLLNVVYGYVSPYLPTSMQTGLVQTAVLAVGAIGLGYAVGRFVSKDIGDDVAFGGLSVVLYSAASTIAQSAGLTITNNLSGYADYTPRRLGAYLKGTPNTAGFRAGMGAYMKGTPNTAGFKAGLGYISPAPVVRSGGLTNSFMKQAPMNVAPSLGWSGDGM